MAKMDRVVLPLLFVWLVAWIALSWPAIQDDALIHLRYADNLFRCHFITYDGVHANYGASSLLYVAVLAMLRGLTASPNLPRAVSSGVHLLLFSGLAYALVLRLPTTASLARMAGLILLYLTVTPSAVRWLDDGMETGLVVCFASLGAWLIHRQCERARAVQSGISRRSYLLLVVFSLAAVLLRTELLLLCAAGFLIMVSSGMKDRSGAGFSRADLVRTARDSSHLLVGAGLAMVLIFSTMRVLLPDTAVAKSRGIANWFHPVHDTAITLGGAFSFGIGMLIFWLLSLALVVLHDGRLRPATVLANSFFPVVLALSALRGQEIQGVRYFAWTFFFAIMWNILDLARPVLAQPVLAQPVLAQPELARPVLARTALAQPGHDGLVARSRIVLSLFLALLILDLPFEAVAMHHVLTHRSATMRLFEAQHLDVLRTRRGLVSDIGYIGYFTGADLCDLAGLVNGRAKARLSSPERAQAGLRAHPAFIFVNKGQLVPLIKMAGRTPDLSHWQVCGRYDFTNLRTPDTHYLIVSPAISAEVCRATGVTATPVSALLQ